MRIFRRGWISTRRLMVQAAWVLVSSLAFLAPEGQLSAQTATASAADQEWSVRDSQGFRSRSLSLGSLFQIRLDGRTLSPTWSSDRQSSSSSSSSSPQKSGSSSSNNSSTPERKPIDPKIEFEAEYQVKPVTVVRHMRLDPKRRAVRILDVFTNPESQDRTIRIDYQTYLSERGGTRFGGVLNQTGESREYGNGVPDDTITALIFAERQDSSALPLFVWGVSGARWPVSVQDISSNVSLSYEGTIPAKGKVALLHWVAVAGQDKSVKIERTSDLFWKDGRLIDPMVPADIAPLVVNFTPDSLKATAVTADSAAPLASGRLIHLEELCGKLSVTRGAKDILWMGKDEHFSGNLTGAAVQLRSSSTGSGNDDRAIEIPLADIAGIRGGGGRGREHRVYLRDGAVLTGRVSLKDCRLAGELGDLTLDADALELLLMRVTSADGKVPRGVMAFAELRNGALHWLASRDGGGGVLGSDVELVTVFGSLSLPLHEIWSLDRRTEPPFNLITMLSDGSRIHGVSRQPVLQLSVMGVGGTFVPTSVRTAELLRFGAADLLARQMALPGSDGGTGDKGAANATDKARTEPPPRYCWLRDGSLLVGTIANPALSLRTAGNEVELKTEDILRMAFDAANGSVANIELRSGAKMQGELVGESVEWRLGERKITLPVGWLQEVMRKDLPAPLLPDPAPTVRVPGENNPLALPPGIPKEQLVEMKVEYPPATAEGHLRVWGTLSVPRLDKCDEASVKPRLTFLVPKGTSNVALKKPLTVSAPDSAIGVLTNINDGSAKDDGGDHVALEGGLQWVQIDLQKPCHIWKVLLWHYHRMPVVYQDVIVQVSDDPAFKSGVKTIFNSDHDNSSGLGKGPDTAYVETNHGWLMDGAGAQGRYIRFYSKGNSYSEKNDYLEAMVFGTPVEPKVAESPATTSLEPDSGEETRIMTPQYPKSEPAAFSGVPNVDPKLFPHFQKLDVDAMRARLSFKVPAGASMVSVKKAVTCSVPSIKPEELSRVTNRTAEFSDMLELPGGLQWVQIDLGALHRIFKILAWHRFDSNRRVYHDVVVQVSPDPDFKKGVITLFNNDHDDSAKLGKGSDPAYLETSGGLFIEGHDAIARYVRLYSRGNSVEDKNHYCEVLVAGLKIEDQKQPGPVSASASTTEKPSSSPAPAVPATSSPGEPTTPFPLPPKPGALTAAEEAKKAAAPNNPLAIPKGMSREQLEEVKPNYPKAMFIGTPVPTGNIPNLENLAPEEHKARLNFLVPEGAAEVAQGKTVTSSDTLPLIGTLDLVTDGDADGADGCYVELAPGLQWVQIDLGASHQIWKVLLWHFHKQASVYYDVIVQVGDDPKFEKGVQTIFNNDHDNSAKLGKGPDPSYVETHRGRLIDGGGSKGRYIRFYSNGSTANEMNHYIEAMVYGTPVSRP